MTLRADAHATLTHWVAPSTAQEQLRQTYLAHLAAHRDAMRRECHPDHLTASAL